MAWRRCLRLITVDETTVSSSQSSSSSRLFLFALLHLHLRRFDASLYSSPFSIFPVPSHSLHRDVLNILFSLSGSPLFFRSLLISFHFILRARCLPFLFDAASLFLLHSSVSSSSSSLHSALDPSSLDSLLQRDSFFFAIIHG